MDQSSKLRLKGLKCCANINNPRCNRNKLRAISSTMVEKIHSMGYNHEIDETMSICESCRSVISHNRSPVMKKRRSVGNEVNIQPSTSGQQHSDDPGPSTSGHQSVDELGKNR